MRYFIRYSASGIPWNLRRLDMESDPVVLERWDFKTGSWVWDAKVLDAVSGFSEWEPDYVEITEEEAKEYLAGYKPTITDDEAREFGKKFRHDGMKN